MKPSVQSFGAAAIERPIRTNDPGGGLWGSDAMAQALRSIDVPYVCLNPGASFRGLHDSLVNHLGNEDPQMLLCLHEEHAVAIAHGYAKVTGRPLAVILHSGVGLMHGAMGLFNAWCDRVPLVALGSTGPLDARSRRPWIDWIHTAVDQAALIRPFIKWDDQPGSAGAAADAIIQANHRARTAPCGPVYVCLDAALQEAALPAPIAPPDPRVLRGIEPPGPDKRAVSDAVRIVSSSRRPVFLMGRVSRDLDSWNARIALAERIGAHVVTDLKCGASFPTEHPLHAPGPSQFLSPGAADLLREADLVLAFDWVDLAGTLKSVWGTSPVMARVVHVSIDHHLHVGWNKDHFGLPPLDLLVQSDPDLFIAAIMPEITMPQPPARPAREPRQPPPEISDGDPIDPPGLIKAVHTALAGKPATLMRAPLSWRPGFWPFEHPLDYLGSDGGAGIGSGPGMSVGAALALRGSDRIAVSILGDGDFLMGVTAIWTAVHYRVPMLVVIANNQSYFNDELHQERVARVRDRPIDNRWVGQAIRDPDINLAGLAADQGAVGIGPVLTARDLPAALAEAVVAVEAGACVVVDVRTQSGYDAATASALMQNEAGRASAAKPNKKPNVAK